MNQYYTVDVVLSVAKLMTAIVIESLHESP